jgi:hypothetical protein
MDKKELQELAREYTQLMNGVGHVRIIAFDYYEDNNYCFDGITPSYKYYYEKSGKK